MPLALFWYNMIFKALIILGVGKTTLIKKVCEVLKSQSVNIQGFYTQEVRERGQRTGFSVISLDGEIAPLATIQKE